MEGHLNTRGIRLLCMSGKLKKKVKGGRKVQKKKIRVLSASKAQSSVVPFVSQVTREYSVSEAVLPISRAARIGQITLPTNANPQGPGVVAGYLYLNPLELPDDWLKIIAAGFEFYKFTKMKMFMKHTSPYTVGGVYTIATMSDPADSIPEIGEPISLSRLTALNRVESSMVCDACLDLTKHLKKDVWYQVSPSGTTPADYRMNYQMLAIVVFHGMTNPDNVVEIGDWTMEYTIELKDPAPPQPGTTSSGSTLAPADLNTGTNSTVFSGDLARSIIDGVGRFLIKKMPINSQLTYVIEELLASQSGTTQTLRCDGSSRLGKKLQCVLEFPRLGSPSASDAEVVTPVLRLYLSNVAFNGPEDPEAMVNVYTPSIFPDTWFWNTEIINGYPRPVLYAWYPVAGVAAMSVSLLYGTVVPIWFYFTYTAPQAAGTPITSVSCTETVIDPAISVSAMTFKDLLRRPPLVPMSAAVPDRPALIMPLKTIAKTR